MEKLAKANDQLNESFSRRSQLEVSFPPTYSLTRTLLQGSPILLELSTTAAAAAATSAAMRSSSPPAAPPPAPPQLAPPASPALPPQTTTSTSSATARVVAATTASKRAKAAKKKMAAVSSAATAKARTAARLAAPAPAPRNKIKSKATKRSGGSSTTGAPERFHYLGGSLSLRSERERRKELELRLVATQSAVQQSTDELEPAVGVLLKSVESLEHSAEERQKLDYETGQALEGLRTTASILQAEHKMEITRLESQFNDRISSIEERMHDERARDKIAFTTLARSHQAELALLRSKFIAFHESTRKRLESLPSAISKLRAEAHALVEPVKQRLAVMAQAVGQLDQAVFDVDREQLRMKLSMRSEDPTQIGSPSRGNSFTNDSLDQSTSSDGPSHMVRESVVRRLQRDVRELTAEVSRDRSALRQRTDDQATRLSDLGSRIDTQNGTQQRANSELHELVTRITSVMQGDLFDQLKIIRNDLIEKIDEKAHATERSVRDILQSGEGEHVSKQSDIANHVQATASRASVDADEALRYSREALAKIGSVDAGLAARLVQARESAARRTKELETNVENLTRRVDVLSSELATRRKIETTSQFL